MRDLNGDICRERHQLSEKRAGLFGSIRPVKRDGSTRVNHDRHPVGVRGTKYGLQLFHVLRIFDPNVRVAKMQFYPATSVRILGTARDLSKRVILKRIETTKCDEPFRIESRLGSDPVVLFLNLFVFVLRLASRPAV